MMFHGDYKKRCLLTIRVSQILYLTQLISEIKNTITAAKRLFSTRDNIPCLRSRNVGFGKAGVVRAAVDTNVTVDAVVADALSVLSFDEDSELSSSMKGTDSDSSLEPDTTCRIMRTLLVWGQFPML